MVAITLPESVKSIKFGAFSECTLLESITLPKSLEQIEGGAFFTCTALTNITVHKGNTHYKTIDGILFSYDEKELIYYPAGKTDTTYTVPEGVTSIEPSAFSNRKSLVTVNIPESVTHICGSAFEGCTNLKNIAIPEGVTLIGGGAFKDCISLESLTIPWGVCTIGSGVFENCTGLRSITITRNVTVIKDRAFFGCKRLERITVDEGDKNRTVTRQKDEFREGILKNNQYREGFLVSTTSIGWSAFEGCESLKTITIPDGAYSIGSGAFKDCKNLESVIIPKSVNYIGRNLFEGCASLENIYYKGSVFRWNKIEKAFYCPEYIKLGEGDGKLATKHYNYSDSKVYQIMRKCVAWYLKDCEDLSKSIIVKIGIGLIIVGIIVSLLGF